MARAGGGRSVQFQLWPRPPQNPEHDGVRTRSCLEGRVPSAPLRGVRLWGTDSTASPGQVGAAWPSKQWTCGHQGLRLWIPEGPVPGVWGVWRQCAGPAPLGGLGWGSLGAGASLGGAWVPALPWRWRPRWASRPATWGHSWSPTAPPYPTPSVKGGPSEASPHPCHFRWSPQDPSSAALSLPHDSHQAPGAPGLPGQANQAPHSFQTLPLKAWPGGVLKGLRPSPRAAQAAPPARWRWEASPLPRRPVPLPEAS